MSSYTLDSNMQGVLDRVRDGMDVYDADGKRVGKVRSTYFGAGDMSSGGDASSGSRVEMWGDSSTDNYGGDNNLPGALASRLRQEGYVKIKWAGLFSADRYALPDQIHSVGETVQLSVRGDELAHN